MLEQAGPASSVHCVLNPGPPAQAVIGARQRLDLETQRRHVVRAEPAEPDQLLPHHLRLQLPLRRHRRVLEVAAAALPGSRPRARSRDPVRRGREDLNRVGAQEALALIGDDRPHPLPRQRVPDEHDVPVGGPGHAVSTVGDRADLELQDRLVEPAVGGRHDRGAAFVRDRRFDGVACSESDGFSSVVPIEVARGPRGTSRDRNRSSRSRSFVDVDASWYGTLVTITPGSNSSRPLMRRALWLCSRFSHHFPTTYSGMKTVTTSRGESWRSDLTWLTIGPVISRYGDSMTVSGTPTSRRSHSSWMRRVSASSTLTVSPVSESGRVACA